MRPLTQFAALTLLPLLLLGAQCDVKPTPYPAVGGSPGSGGMPGLGGLPAAGGYPWGTGGSGVAGATGDGRALCIAAVYDSEGVRNVAVASGRSLGETAAAVCSSPALRNCYARGNCK